MKLPAFNYAKMEWDSWRAFHIEHGYNRFVQFDTGEFVVCNSSWRPDTRQVYKELHIQIVATDDEACPRLYVPGSTKPIFKSHLNYKGQQTLLLDLDHKRAVGLCSLTEDMPFPARFADSEHPAVPNRGRSVAAWYAGPDAVPVGAPITRHYPQPLTSDQRSHIKELEDACKVWLQMQPNPVAFKKTGVKLKVADFIDVSFNVLTTDHRVTIAMSGFDMIVKEEHPWLTFNVEEGVTDDKTENN